jgi:hypothetical protein
MKRAALAEIILLSAWLGAALLVAVVLAPAAFRVLPTRTLAGAIVGAVLPVVFIAGLVIAFVVGLLFMSRERRLRAGVIGSIAAMIVGCGVAQFGIGPRIEAVRASISGPVDSLDPSDPRRAQFGRLHGISVMFMGVAMLGAAGGIVTLFLRPDPALLHDA